VSVLDFKKRSVGEVLAPHAEAELVEKLATSVERAAVLKYLRAEYGELKTLISVIEKGEHHGR
jgi:hypothetical protein